MFSSVALLHLSSHGPSDTTENTNEDVADKVVNRATTNKDIVGIETATNTRVTNTNTHKYKTHKHSTP